MAELQGMSESWCKREREREVERGIKRKREGESGSE
jgi:hypothetical protein